MRFSCRPRLESVDARTLDTGSSIARFFAAGSRTLTLHCVAIAASVLMLSTPAHGAVGLRGGGAYLDAGMSLRGGGQLSDCCAVAPGAAEESGKGRSSGKGGKKAAQKGAKQKEEDAAKTAVLVNGEGEHLNGGAAQGEGVHELCRPGLQDGGADPTIEHEGNTQGQGDAAGEADTTVSGAGEERDDACDDLVLLLDLDKCSIFGNDVNDLGVAMQWLNKTEDAVAGLYGILVNPLLPSAYESIRKMCSKQGASIKVAIYTRRQLLLKYTSQFRDSMIGLQWDPDWHENEQVYIPSHITTGEEVMDRYSGPSLLTEEFTDVLRSLQRLLSARDAIKQVLKLDTNPVTVVTANQKVPDMTTSDIMRKSGSSGRAFKSILFDDNICLQGEEGVVTVEPFVVLEDRQGDRLAAYLRKHLPLSELCEDEDLVHFLLSASSNEACLVENQGVVNYRIPYRAGCLGLCGRQPSEPPEGPLKWDVPKLASLKTRHMAPTPEPSEPAHSSTPPAQSSSKPLPAAPPSPPQQTASSTTTTTTTTTTTSSSSSSSTIPSANRTGAVGGKKPSKMSFMKIFRSTSEAAISIVSSSARVGSDMLRGFLRRQEPLHGEVGPSCLPLVPSPKPKPHENA